MKQNKEDFLTGVGAVDAEHVVLLDLTDQVGALLADENMLFKCADIRQLLKRLEDYTTMHFTHEEQLMEKMGYGGIEETASDVRAEAGRVYRSGIEAFARYAGRHDSGSV